MTPTSNASFATLPTAHRTAADSTLALAKYPHNFPSTIERLEKASRRHSDEDIGRFAIDALVYIQFPYPEEYINCRFAHFGSLIRAALFTKPGPFQKAHYPLIAELSLRSESSTQEQTFLICLYRLMAFTVITNLANARFAPNPSDTASTSAKKK